jgi:predicted TIM-barrel fold metal-dependent hydrolase
VCDGETRADYRGERWLARENRTRLALDRGGVGVDNILWSSDFPHSATFWPKSREKIAADFQNVDAAEKQKILCDNTTKLYGFEGSRAQS